MVRLVRPCQRVIEAGDLIHIPGEGRVSTIRPCDAIAIAGQEDRFAAVVIEAQLPAGG